MTALPSLREGRRLIRALDELEAATIVSAARPTAGRAPRMQRMVAAVYTDYQRTLAGRPDAQPRVDRESFADLRNRAQASRGSVSADRRSPSAAPPRNIEPDVDDRIARYSDELHGILQRTGTRRQDLGRPVMAASAEGYAPIVRARSLTPPDARKIRLAHELGAKPVAALTVVRLTGDMVSALSRAGTPALVRFHGGLVGVGLRYWKGLITNVAQLVSTLLGLALGLLHIRSRTEISGTGELRGRLSRLLAVSPRWLCRETQELIGQGGKVFETGTNAAVRSLLQPDGTITTHAREDALADAALLQRHASDIDAWLNRLLEGWKAANDLLRLLATVVLILVAGVEFANQTWYDFWHALLQIAIATLTALLVRVATAAVIRYLIFHAY